MLKIELTTVTTIEGVDIGYVQWQWMYDGSVSTRFL